MNCSLAQQTTRHESGIRTMPASCYPVRTRVHYTVSLPTSCCPVSRNPRPGSTLTLRFRPASAQLEVYAFESYLKRFVGGHPDGERNMEGMVEMIARDCARALGVPVRARADLILDRGRMTVSVKATP